MHQLVSDKHLRVMVYKFYRVASRIANLNALLNHAHRKVYLNTAQKARSNSTVAWPPPNLLKNYQKFQRDDGLPVHLKSGFSDRMIYNITWGLTALGLADGFYNLLTMAYPKKKT